MKRCTFGHLNFTR